MKTFGYDKDYVLGLLAALLMMKESKVRMIPVDGEVIFKNSNYYLKLESIDNGEILLEDFTEDNFIKYIKEKEKNKIHISIIETKPLDGEVEHKVHITQGNEDEHVEEVLKSISTDIYKCYNVKAKKDFKYLIKMIHEELEKMQISDSFYEDDFLQEGMNVLEKSNYIDREQINKEVADSIFRESLFN